MNEDPVQLVVQPIGGDFEVEPYMDNLGMFSPRLSTLGNNQVVYSYTNLAGCFDADTIQIQVLDTARNTLSINPAEGCEILHVTMQTEAENMVEWEIDGVVRSTDFEYTDSFANGNYSVTLTVQNADGCEITRTNTIEVFKNPEADFSYSPEDIYISQPEVFFNDLSIGNVVGWDWTLGDGESSNAQNPVHNYTDGGTYTVTLYIEDDNGCVDSTEQLVTVKDELLLFIPTAFTPNGDGVNDVFRLSGLGIVNANVKIYNRWGEKLIDEDNFSGWDGTYMGEPAQTGVYIYTVTIMDTRGKRTYKKGEIHLVR